MRAIERQNISNLKEISLNIENVLGFLDQKAKHADKIQAERRFIKNNGPNNGPLL